MINKKIFKEYCTGCGLCQSVDRLHLEEDEKGFLKPIEITAEQKKFCEKVCLISGAFWNKKPIKLWGQCEVEPFYGYAQDSKIRYKASSGGILSACAIYLLEKKIVDGILQVGISPNSHIKTKLVCSYTKDEVILSILVYTFFTRMFDLMLPFVAKHSIAVV